MDTERGSAVALLSGGLDSSVLLHHVARDLGRKPLHAISCDYGQRHDRELACARWQAQRAGVAHHCVLNLQFLGKLVQNATSLVHGGADVPDLASLAPQSADQPPTYVPHRNMVLLSIAAAYAESCGATDVFYGAQAQDEYGYWDCTVDFVDRLNHTLALNRRNAVTIHAPFATLRKAETVRIGMRLGVDFAHTWSCYRGADRPCDACPTCVERRHAFEEAGLTDPLTQTALP
ncbi:MAG TPA: 7-cyano-7-deazaguanine synthase QueC [Candidatus Hydrogenedentes bacterium]|nr:7-cyano-7-deazaguanine synthase QueC [Candidatus Hydrogenedentota bacterium]